MSVSANPIRQARKERNWTLDDLAARLKISSGQMSRIERNGTTSLEHALTLSEALGLPVQTFRARDAVQ